MLVDMRIRQWKNQNTSNEGTDEAEKRFFKMYSEGINLK
jgi:hypothetical protein